MEGGAVLWGDACLRQILTRHGTRAGMRYGIKHHSLLDVQIRPASCGASCSGMFLEQCMLSQSVAAPLHLVGQGVGCWACWSQAGRVVTCDSLCG